MKKLFVLGITMSLAMATAMAQTTAQPAKATKSATEGKATTAGPVISFAEKSHDFGNINQGDVVEYTFKFKNTGNAPLVISNVGVTCGCTATDWPKEPIMPGKSSQITAKFNSAGKMGHQNKVITVNSNAAGEPATVSIISNVLEKQTVENAAVAKPEVAPAAVAAPSVQRAEVKTSTKVKAKGKK